MAASQAPASSPASFPGEGLASPTIQKNAAVLFDLIQGERAEASREARAAYIDLEAQYLEFKLSAEQVQAKLVEQRAQVERTLAERDEELRQSVIAACGAATKSEGEARELQQRLAQLVELFKQYRINVASFFTRIDRELGPPEGSETSRSTTPATPASLEGSGQSPEMQLSERFITRLKDGLAANALEISTLRQRCDTLSLEKEKFQAQYASQLSQLVRENRELEDGASTTADELLALRERCDTLALENEALRVASTETAREEDNTSQQLIDDILRSRADADTAKEAEIAALTEGFEGLERERDALREEKDAAVLEKQRLATRVSQLELERNDNLRARTQAEALTQSLLMRNQQLVAQQNRGAVRGRANAPR